MVFSDSQADTLRPVWWRDVANTGTKLFYQPAQRLIVYIVPVTDIMGRLALMPYGEDGTIPHDWRTLARYYPLGECVTLSVIVRTAREAEVSSTTSISGPCSGFGPPQRCSLANQLQEHECELKVHVMNKTNFFVHYVHTDWNLDFFMCTPVANCAHLIMVHFLCTLCAHFVHTVHTLHTR